MRTGTDRRTFLKTAAIGSLALAARPRIMAGDGGPRPLLHRVHHVPPPDFTHGNRHPGVESLLFALAGDGRRFYRTASGHPLGSPDGLIAPDDTVVIKVNAQWKYRGCTNSDVVRGIVQRILDHPDGFTGEVVIYENGQGRGSLNCDTTSGCDGGSREIHANAENEKHSFTWLVEELFQDGRVGQKEMDDHRGTFVDEGDHDTEGFRRVGNVTYPCFFTPKGTRVELREGIWTGSGYDSDHLKWINVAVLKDHKDLNVTGVLKHVYGIITTTDSPLPIHDPNHAGTIMGEVFTLVRAPVLNILDCIWVSHASLCGYPPDTTTRRDMLVAGTDPCAIDAWAARHILYPISGDPAHDPDIPGYFRTYLLGARDTINDNGGIDGVPVTFDEADIDARHVDQRKVDLRVWKSGDDVNLSWAGGAGPWRVEKDSDPTFPAPQVIADATWETDLVDAGAATDGETWFYRVTGS